MTNFKYVILLTLLLMICSKANSQSSKNQLKVSDFKFSSIFAAKEEGEDNNIYCLLGSGFFKAPQSDNIEFLINRWIEKHPKAELVPVSSLNLNTEDMKLIYCWVISPNDTLNIHLVKNGAVAGGTMLRPRIYEEAEHKNVDIENIVSDSIYNSFINKIKLAEKEAFSRRIGIWANFVEKEAD